VRPLQPGEFDRRGEQTGRVWRAHIARPLPFAGSGRYFLGEDDGEVVLLHELPKEDLYVDDIVRARRAIEIYGRPEIREAPTIRQLIDIAENEYVLVLVYEWAEQALHEALAAGHVTGADADEIAGSVGAALAVLHGLGLVHCDVAPTTSFGSAAPGSSPTSTTAWHAAIPSRASRPSVTGTPTPSPARPPTPVSTATGSSASANGFETHASEKEVRQTRLGPPGIQRSGRAVSTYRSRCVMPACLWG
jgi:hypothetical protein